MSSDNAPDFLCAGPAVLGLFVGLCGLTVLFLFNPQLLYEDITQTREDGA